MSRSAAAAALAALIAALAVTAVAVGTPTAPAGPETRAGVVVARVVLPGGETFAGGELRAPPAASESLGGWSHPADGSIVSVLSSSASVASQAGASASAQAIVEAISATLFGGEIVIGSAAARAGAAAGPENAAGDTSTSAVAGVTFLGQQLAVGPGQVLQLADWGSLSVLESTTETAPAPERAARAAVAGVRVRLTAPHGGLPANALIEIAVAEASASAELPPPDVAPPTTATTPAVPAPAPAPVTPKLAAPGAGGPSTPAPAAGGGETPATQAPSRTVGREPGRSVAGRPDELVRPIPTGVRVRLSTGGYVFPIYGPASFGDSFGAPRGSYIPGGWHHGEDIFAPAGAPVLAVADGTVFLVGWNDIGGWRLWLRDRAGNEFYYAHLSAFSPLARAGTRVRAGDVIGFMGNTGDAEASPPHLHFEIHPAALLSLGYDGVVAPYPYLAAWRRAQDVDFAAGRTWLPDVTGAPRPAAPPAGAILLASADISRASGLVPGALERALADTRAGQPPPSRTP